LSWGYQTTGWFAPTSRYGSPDDFRAFIDAAHQAGLGVILDWVPGHFPTDAYGLARFDGTALYEHADRREGFHAEWGTFVFNLGRREVANFLLNSALYWLREFHLDGLRVDAVASLLYRDYSRAAGAWFPMRSGDAKISKRSHSCSGSTRPRTRRSTASQPSPRSRRRGRASPAHQHRRPRLRL